MDPIVSGSCTYTPKGELVVNGVPVSINQQTLMKFNPTTGERDCYPTHAAQYRTYHGPLAWLFNPWTGKKRHPADVGTDPLGLAIVDTDRPVQEAPLQNVEALYKELLDVLGVDNQDRAVLEIRLLREKVEKLNKLSEEITKETEKNLQDYQTVLQRGDRYKEHG